MPLHHLINVPNIATKRLGTSQLRAGLRRMLCSTTSERATGQREKNFSGRGNFSREDKGNFPLRHWTEAVHQGPHRLATVFHLIPKGNFWAIPTHTVRGYAVGIVDWVRKQITILDHGRCFILDAKALILQLVKEFCIAKKLLHQSQVWSYHTILCRPCYADDPWIQANITYSINTFLLEQWLMVSPLSQPSSRNGDVTWPKRTESVCSPGETTRPNPEELQGADRLQSTVTVVCKEVSQYPPLDVDQPVSPNPSIKEDAFLECVIHECPILTENELPDLTPLATALAKPAPASSLEYPTVSWFRATEEERLAAGNTMEVEEGPAPLHGYRIKKGPAILMATSTKAASRSATFAELQVQGAVMCSKLLFLSNAVQAQMLQMTLGQHAVPGGSQRRVRYDCPWIE